MYDIDLMNREEGIIVDIRNEDRVFIEKNETKKRKLSILRVRFRDGKEHDFLCNVTNYEVKEDEGKLEELAYNNMDQYDMLTSQLIRHSFAITVHSAQGSEWPHVVFFIPAREKKYQSSYRSNASQGDRFLTSNLVYTAITRATTSVIIVCPDSQIVVNAASQREAWRCDNLHAKIKRLTPEGEEVDPEMIEYSDQQALMNTMDDDDYFIFGDM
jgi:ATP-dependent exoDNAse (exonuclease V) alpha subunit